MNAAVVGTIAATTWTLFLTAAINLAMPVLAVPLAGVALDLPATLLAASATALLLRDRAPNSTHPDRHWCAVGAAGPGAGRPAVAGVRSQQPEA